MRRHQLATEEVRLASQSEDELEEQVVLMLAWRCAPGGVEAGLVRLAGIWRERRHATEQPDGSHSIFGPLLLWPLYATLTLPWLGCEAAGLLNVLGGGSAPTAATWVLDKSIKHRKRRSSELWRRGGEQLEVCHVPVPTRPGARVTLMRRRGMLGMSYISER